MIETIEEGHYTKDLAICVHGTTKVSATMCRSRCCTGDTHAPPAALHVLIHLLGRSLAVC